MVELFTKVNNAVMPFFLVPLLQTDVGLEIEGCAVVRWKVVFAGRLWKAQGT